ncbi:MAG: type II toxin-antitoxin system RelE/ParE family toxin [Marichromatium sp.]|nr:type II toxin-antitoxin system RelE/ParE family toxin [Marichromatium sp.]
MIVSWRHKGLKDFWLRGSRKGIRAEHAERLEAILTVLDSVTTARDAGRYLTGLHPLKGRMRGLYAVQVSGNWRVVFAFKDGDAELLDYMDYH